MAREGGPDLRVVGGRLRTARKACGITQAEAARRLGASRPTLSATERGLRAPGPDEVLRLARLYGRAVDEFVGRPEAPVELRQPLRAAVDPRRVGMEEMELAIAGFERLVDDCRELDRIEHAGLARDYPREVQLPGRRDVRPFAEELAERERRRLALGDQPLPGLRRTLEDAAEVSVFPMALPRDAAAMYAHAGGLGYCIAVNSTHDQQCQHWSLARAYCRCLWQRHKPGIDYVSEGQRRTRGAAFCETFASNFIMPRPSVRQRFYSVERSTGDFTVADLCRLSADYLVPVRTMALRLEGLGLLRKGTWGLLRQRGTREEKLSDGPGPVRARAAEGPGLPERSRRLAVDAFRKAKIGEAELAAFLRCDRTAALDIAGGCLGRIVTTRRGRKAVIELPAERSLLTRGPA